LLQTAVIYRTDYHAWMFFAIACQTSEKSTLVRAGQVKSP